MKKVLLTILIISLIFFVQAKTTASGSADPVNLITVKSQKVYLL